MGLVRRFSKVVAVVVLASLATGCIVLPLGRGHIRHGGGDRYYAPVGESQPGGHGASREAPRREH